MFFVIFVLVFIFKHFIHSFIFIYTLSPLFPAMPFILFIFIVFLFFFCVASLISRESFQMLSHRQTEEESSAWGEKTRQHLPGFYWWEQNKRRLHSVATLVKTFLKMISFTQKGVCVSVIHSDWIVFFFSPFTHDYSIVVYSRAQLESRVWFQWIYETKNCFKKS